MKAIDRSCGLLILSFVLMTAFSVTATAQDIVKAVLVQSANDQRGDYKFSLLKAIFEHSRPQYGEYQIVSVPPTPRARAYVEMQTGEYLNLHFAPADSAWEETHIPIRIPVRKGLLNYRLLLINKSKLDAFQKVENAGELKQFTVGLRTGWTTVKVMESLGFPVIETSTYDGVFTMLDHDRFDFVPQGVNEIFGALEARQSELSNLVIEPRLAIKMPMPVYIYVSRQNPRLAERVLAGFGTILENGVFDKLFSRFFAESVRKANLSQRHIIDLGNPLLSPETPLNTARFWLDPYTMH